MFELEGLSELLRAVYHTAPCDQYPEGITWRAKADEQQVEVPYDYGQLKSQASAWEAVYFKCKEVGMTGMEGSSGKTTVLNFIEKQARENKNLAEKAKKWDALERIRTVHSNKDLTLCLYKDGSTYIGTCDRENFSFEDRSYSISALGELEHDELS